MMRLCRIDAGSGPRSAFYSDDTVIPLTDAAAACQESTGTAVALTDGGDLLEFLPGGDQHAAARQVADWLDGDGNAPTVKTADVSLLLPNPRPPKLFLLAGNYARHIEEGGETAAERAETFPYVFMKPPSTTLTAPGDPVRIPRRSPDHVDWELELGVVIGRGGKHIGEADALSHVAGYTIFNDISDRRFRPNPDRKERSRDAFFDWLHGKWHDSSCPSGPCITSAENIDPQTLEMTLSVNGQVRQQASTAQQIFPVAAVIEFLSGFVTLEPGDMISTGTSAGVGNTTQTYLQPGDTIEATIERIGTLVSPVVAE